MSTHDHHRGSRTLERRIAGAAASDARRYAFGVARLACSVTEVHDVLALEVALGGLERLPEIDELVRLWDLERELDSTCAARVGADPSTCPPEQLARHPVCREARAVAAVIAALRPDAFVAASGATREALAAGCRQTDLDTTADGLL